MKFILQMARREIRSSWRRMLFFFVCIGVGVAAIVAVRSLIRNVNDGVASQARELITADVQADTTRPWTKEELSAIDSASAGLVAAKTETLELTTMVRPADQSHQGLTVVELKGVEAGFPLYGEFTLTGGKRFDYSMLENNGIVVAQALLERLNLSVGDSVNVGQMTFQIRGVIDEEPGSGGGFRLGPRVFVAKSAVERSGLMGFGSRVRHRLLFKVRDSKVSQLASALKAKLNPETVHVDSYRDSEDNISDALTRTENYLSLVGLIVVVLGGIGISNVTRVFVEQRRKSIAVLKCIGGTSRRITAVYLFQIIALAIVGSMFGVGLAKVALASLAKYLAASLPRHISYGLQLTAVAQGTAIGVLICLLFAALPLLRIRRIRPNTLLRDEAGDKKWRLDPLRWATGIVVAAGLVAVCSWQAGSLRVGIYFLAGLTITAAILYVTATLLIAIVRRARNAGSFAMRQGINSLYRPGNQTRVVIMAVGLGVFLIIAVWSLQSNLLKQFDLSRQGNLPNMFLIDIQKDQADGVTQFIRQSTGTEPKLVPTLRARIKAINGRELSFQPRDHSREHQRLGHEYLLTYRAGLDPNETVVEGKLWPATPSSEPEVSLDENMKGLMGIGLGSTIVFDIQGRDVTARVTSFRSIDIKNSRTAFAVLFRPGVLESAPQMLVAAVNGPADDTVRARFQRSLVDKYPNVTVIDVAELVKVIEKVLDNITLAVSFIGAFVFLSGALILIGSIAMTKFQRIYEIALLKTLGAKRRSLIGMMLAEYGLMGLVAGIIGSATGVGLSYAIAKRILEIPWTFASGIGIVGIVGTLLLVTVVGAAASLDALTHRPLSVLRSE